MFDRCFFFSNIFSIRHYGWVSIAAHPGNVVCMKVQVNGESLTFDVGTTLYQLLEAQQLLDKRIAAEVNGEIVPRSSWPSHALYEADQIEIVHAIGGG